MREEAADDEASAIAEPGTTDGSGSSDALTPRRAARGVASVDAWLYQTCQHCLELVVDLTVKFYVPVTSTPDVFPRLLALLVSLSTRAHEPLAACGVGALSRLFIARMDPLITS